MTRSAHRHRRCLRIDFVRHRIVPHVVRLTANASYFQTLFPPGQSWFEFASIICFHVEAFLFILSNLCVSFVCVLLSNFTSPKITPFQEDRC